MPEVLSSPPLALTLFFILLVTNTSFIIGCVYRDPPKSVGLGVKFHRRQTFLQFAYQLTCLGKVQIRAVLVTQLSICSARQYLQRCDAKTCTGRHARTGAGQPNTMWTLLLSALCLFAVKVDAQGTWMKGRVSRPAVAVCANLGTCRLAWLERNRQKDGDRWPRSIAAPHAHTRVTYA